MCVIGKCLYAIYARNNVFMEECARQFVNTPCTALEASSRTNVTCLLRACYAFIVLWQCSCPKLT